jgi:hypothetical protein
LKSREWFDYIRAEILELASLESTLERLREQATAHGQQLASVGHGSGGGDTSGAMVRIVAASKQADEQRTKVDALLERATTILYGDHGRGGLARVKGYATADCVCGYYLMGMTWRQVADEMVRPDSNDGAHWCRDRSRSAFAYIDAGRLGDVIPNEF